MKNWIESYQKYTEETESPVIFHEWTAFACVSAALQRKTWFRLGRFKIYPNLFIVLVAEPGVARKTQAKNFGEDILAQVTGVILSADSTSPQAMLEDLENSAQQIQADDGSIFEHNSISVFVLSLNICFLKILIMFIRCCWFIESFLHKSVNKFFVLGNIAAAASILMSIDSSLINVSHNCFVL